MENVIEFKNLVVGAIIEHNGIIAEIDETNMENENEIIIFFYADKESYKNRDYIEEMFQKGKFNVIYYIENYCYDFRNFNFYEIIY